jgi:carnitine O-palmitoyltransferase 1
MAEARVGVGVTPGLGLHLQRIDTSDHRFQASMDSQGVVLFIPNPRFLFRNGLRALWRTKNKVKEAFYPLPMWVVIACNAFAVWRVVRSPTAYAGSRLAKYLWAFDSRLPWTHLLPTNLRVAYLAFNVSAVVLFGITATQRAFLRQLLGYTGWASESRGIRSWKTKVWAFLLKYVYMRGKRPLLLNYQNCLPALPLPSLEETTTKYMQTVEPLLSPEEFKELEKLREEFIKNEGVKLQGYLKLKHAIADNYITDWWLNLVYLRGRDSLTINSNYYGIGYLLAPPTSNQVSRAAKLVQLMVRVKLEIDHEELPPQLLQGFIPICMNQYLSAFSGVREPGLEQDKLVKYDSIVSRHIIVLHKGRVYSVDCFSRRSRRPLTAKQLETTLNGIVNDISTVDPVEAAVPVLTSLNRTKWAEIRESCFQQVLGNAQALEQIEKALFVLSLDDTEPSDLTSEGLNYFLGDMGKNRWVDKCFHLIVCKNGKAGIEAEHTWGDAPALGHIFELVMAREVQERPYDENGVVKKVDRDLRKEKSGKDSNYPAQRIRFNVTPELSQHIQEALVSVRAEFENLDLKVMSHERYGKGLVKKAKCGPDAWLQMALQLAYFRDQGHFDQTYESSMTRLFKHGRTETIRSVSKKSCAFVKAMENPKATNEERVKLLQSACEAHQEYSQAALIGNGVDRHLFALYVVSVGKGIPSPFLQNVLKRKWKLSTSQIPQRQTIPNTWPGNDQGDVYPSPSGGFGPVADDGYGVSYCVVGEYRFAFHVSSKKSASNTDSATFLARIDKAMSDMRGLFPSIPDMPVPKDLPKQLK